MKIAIAFLLLGTCLVSTNAFATGKRMSESEAYSHGRMTSLVLKRLSDWQNCARCSNVERNCMEKAMVDDICFIVKLMAYDMGCKPRELLGSVKLEIHVSIVVDALERDNTDNLVQKLRETGKMHHFMQGMCGMMSKSLKESNVDLSEVLNSVNGVLGGAISSVLNAFSGVLDGVLGGVLGGVTNTIGGIAGGLGDAVGGAVSGVTGALSGVLNAGTNVLGGLLGGLGGKKGGLLG